MSERPLSNSGKKKTRNLTVTLYEGDHELVEWLVEFFGSSRSDVTRSAIRHFAAFTQATQGRRR